jgi:homoserine kinase type II
MAIHTVVPEAALLQVAAAYPLGSLRAYEGLEVGTVNTSYRLDLDAGRFFLRVYEEQGEDGAARETELLRWLSQSGIATPAPIAAKDGRTTLRVQGKPAALFPWVPGEILCQKRVTSDAAFLVGQALARIHRVGHPPDAASIDEGRFGPTALADRCRRVAASKDEDARTLAGLLERDVRAIASRRRPSVPRGLIHGDLFRDNVLWENGAIAAILDFESAHDGPFVYDLAVTILSWTFGDTFDFVLGRAICAGYETERPLEPGERDALYDEAILATLRFTITRITDDAIRIGKRWQRFVERRKIIEALGATHFAAELGL